MALSDQARNLLLEIAMCKKHQERRIALSQCTEIFDYQKQQGIFDLLPVPWQGHVEEAKILFIGSNPSELSNGFLPTNALLDNDNGIETIVDFFENRFDKRNKDIHEIHRRWSSEGIYYLLKPGQLSNKPVPYWKTVKNVWAPVLLKGFLERQGRGIKPGTDYALTEVVHCYSLNEKGVGKAEKECSKYFEKILSVAKEADIIAVIGGHAKDILNKYLKTVVKLKKENYLSLTGGSVLTLELFGKERKIFARPHDGAVKWGFPVALNKYLSSENIKQLQTFVKDRR